MLRRLCFFTLSIHWQLRVEWCTTSLYKTAPILNIIVFREHMTPSFLKKGGLPFVCKNWSCHSLKKESYDHVNVFLQKFVGTPLRNAWCTWAAVCKALNYHWHTFRYLVFIVIHYPFAGFPCSITPVTTEIWNVCNMFLIIRISETVANLILPYWRRWF